MRFALRSPDAKERVRVCEPNKCHEWAWRSVVSPDVQPMFVPLEQLFKSDYWRDHVVASQLRQWFRAAADKAADKAARTVMVAGAVGIGIFMLARSR